MNIIVANMSETVQSKMIFFGLFNNRQQALDYIASYNKKAEEAESYLLKFGRRGNEPRMSNGEPDYESKEWIEWRDSRIKVKQNAELFPKYGFTGIMRLSEDDIKEFNGDLPLKIN